MIVFSLILFSPVSDMIVLSLILFSPASDMTWLCSLWLVATSLSWTPTKHRFCLLALHLVSGWSTVSAQTMAETVFLSKCRLNTSVNFHLVRTLSMQQHMSSIRRASFLEFRRVASIRPCQSQSAAAGLVVTMVIPRLDYCNSVFTGLPADQIARLQRVQNNVARFVMKNTSRNITSQGTSLASRKIPQPVQHHDLCLPLFWRVFTSLSFFISLHLPTV